MIVAVSTVKYHDDEAALKLREELIHPVVKRQKGCKFVYCLKSTDGSGQYLVVIGWETMADRETFLASKDHDDLKEKQWPLMKEVFSTSLYELILD
jgi:heme-degrading monooxygenase HmoA